MNKIFLLFVVFFIVSCSSLKRDSEEAKKQKSNALTAIRLLENQNFSGLKFKESYNKLITQGRVNDISAKITLESGTTASFIDYSYAKKLKLIENRPKLIESKVLTSFGSVDKGEKIFIPTLELQGFKYSNWPVHIIYSPNRKLSIGSDFLLFNNSVLFCKYGILMNSAENEKADSINTFLTTNNYSSTPLLDKYGNDLLKNIPSFIGIKFYIKTTINGDEQLMLINTGSSHTSVYKGLNTDIKPDIQQTKLFLTDASGKSKKLHITEVDSMMINNTCFMKNEKLTIVDRNYRITGTKIYGQIGMDLLVNKNVILDFGNKIMYFAKD